MINLKNKTINIERKLKNQFGYSFSSIRLINQPSYLAAVQTPTEIMCTAYVHLLRSNYIGMVNEVLLYVLLSQLSAVNVNDILFHSRFLLGQPGLFLIWFYVKLCQILVIYIYSVPFYMKAMYKISLAPHLQSL